jgi:adenosylcobinamide-GDP ribazoletransferase
MMGSPPGPGRRPGSDLFNHRLWWSEIRGAIGYLTRLRPARLASDAAPSAPVTAARAFPLVGAALGLTGGLAYGLGALLGFPSLLAALLGVGAMILVSGARPEEFTSRLAEAFGRSAPLEQKLDSLRANGISALGVISLVLIIGAKVGAIADLGNVALVIAAMVGAGAVSRAAVPLIVRYVDPASTASTASGPPGLEDVTVAGGLALLVALIALGGAGLLAVFIAGVVAVLLALLAKRQIGGHTEQVLGGVQVIADVAFLVVIAALK